MSSLGKLRKDWKPGTLSSDPSAFSGLRVAIIGGTGGLGRAIAQSLLAKGAEVIVVGRSLKDPPHRLRSFVQADLSSLVSARNVARDLAAESFDALLLTHGIFAGPIREVTTEGLEKDLATSAMSRWVIVREMAPRLGRGRSSGRPKPRLFVWGLPGGERSLDLTDIESTRNYRWQTAHSNTVVFNEALVRDTVVRFPEINVFGMNPGVIKTNIMAGVLGQASLRLRVQQTLVGLLFQSAETYAEKVVPLVVHPALEDRSGSLFNRHAQPIEPNPWLVADDHCSRVVEAAEALSARVLG
jgi:NAD(P)-dependent dehydrogenase (short-subunit alcohol dehydrogenase family)